MKEDLKKFIEQKMLASKLNESEEQPEVLEEQALLEADSTDEKMSDEDLKIEALKIAINISKLMSNVTPDDMIAIGQKVADFIRNHQIGSSQKKDVEQL